VTGEGDGLSPVARWRNHVRDSDADPTARLVALVLSTYMAADGNSAFPSKATLARGCGLTSTRAVDAAINRLEAAGLLTVRRSPGHAPNTYEAAGIPRPNAQEHMNDDHNPLAYLD
jgi:hypothetical protein